MIEICRVLAWFTDGFVDALDWIVRRVVKPLTMETDWQDDPLFEDDRVC